MSSRQTRKQARQNGAKAAGTKSPAGIQQSSKNSLKHGLTSNMIVLSNESQAKFDELHQTYIETFRRTTAWKWISSTRWWPRNGVSAASG